MKFTFVGTGSAFCLKNFQCNILIENEDKKLLIDAGGDIRFALNEQQLSYKDIDALYITHPHQDHIGGIEYLALTSYFDPSKSPIEYYGHRGLTNDVWTAISPGLATLQGITASFGTFFNMNIIKENGEFSWQSIRFELIQSVHIMNKYSIMPSFGLMMTTEKGTKVYYPSDTQFAPNQMKDFYRESDLIFHDCETSPFWSQVHSHYEELKTLDKEHKSKMWLLHYQDNVVEDWEGWNQKAREDGFLGFLKKGQVIEVDEKAKPSQLETKKGA